MSERLDPALRAEALEQLLTERELVDPSVMDGFVARYETEVGPMNGARVVARAWTDPDYRAWLLRDATAAIADMGFTGSQATAAVTRHVARVPSASEEEVLGRCRFGGDERVEPEERDFGAGQERARLLVLLRLQRLVELLEQVLELPLGHGGLCLWRVLVWVLGR